MKALWQSKTFWVAVIQAIGGVLAAAIAADPAIVTAGWLAVVKSVIDVALRVVSTEPVKIPGA